MKTTDKTAKTWVYVEPYLYKNAESGRYYSRFGRQGFRALKTDRVTVARLRIADLVRDHKSRLDLTTAAGNGDVTMEDVMKLFLQATEEDPEISVSTKRDRRISLLRRKRLGRNWPV